MPESVGIVLGIVLPALLKTIWQALRGDEDARRRLVDIMPMESRSSLERAIDEATINEKFGSER